MRTVLILCSLSIGAGYLSAQAPVEVWAAPSLYKVRPGEAPQDSNLVWEKKTKTISVAGARNEHIPFQVVVSTPPPATRYDPAAAGFFVEASELVAPGRRIPRDAVRLYFEHAILCYGKSSPIGETGFWPDALAPLTDPFGMAAEFRQAVRNRAIWVDVIAPTGTPAGEYSGTIRVTQHGKPVDDLKVKLKVYDFALPEETHLVTYMGVSGRQLAAFHNVQAGSAEAAALLRKYHAFLYANRMEPWFNESLEPKIERRGDELIVQFDSAAYDLYMNQWKTRRVILPSNPRGLERSGYKPFSEPFNTLVKSYLKQIYDYYKKNGWLNRLVLNSPIDEPNTAQAYADTRKWAALVHEAAPGVPFLVTEQPVPDKAEWGTLSGYANNFSVHGNQLNRADVKEAIRREQAKGGEITWYISCDQGYPQPNYFIDAPAMDPVMVPWITWRYGMQGILYWELKFWSQTPDPWLDPVTYLSGFLCSNGYVLNGEGSLLYPGSKVRRYTGQKDVDGPVSSIRFELLREGIEDYEYLWMLKSLGDPGFADEAVKSMVANVGAFSRNPQELFALREKMARRIETLAAKRATTVSSQARQPDQGIDVYSREKEAALGATLAAEVRRNSQVLQASVARSYVETIGARLAANSSKPDLPYSFEIVAGEGNQLHEPTALPGGYIFVPAGLFAAARDEAEFAGMLAHAIVHVTERHGIRERPQGAGVPLIILMGGDTSAAPLPWLKSMRAFESEADVLAAQIMARAGYDPAALVRYIARVQIGPADKPNLRSPFPLRDQRIASIEEIVKSLPPRTYASGSGFEAAQAEIRALTPKTRPAAPSLRRPPATPRAD